MIVYVSGKYSGTPEEIKANIEKAKAVAVELWSKGYVALCPHLNTANFEEESSLLTWDDYIKGDLALLSRCDAIVMLPDFEDSKGALVEFEYAVRNDIPIYEYPELPEFYKTEIICPEQTDAFINVLMSMYRMYIKKNFDYSPANILGTGEIGLVTRLWDKMARLLNLSGFKIAISDMKFEEPIQPKNESINDTYSDLSVYAVIGQVFRMGKWGL